MSGPNRPQRPPDALPLLLPLDGDSTTPLHVQVYEGIRGAILDGSLAAGTRLPSTRVLAADLGVARNTIVAAFEQLRVEGYTTSHRGGGTRVRGVPGAAFADGTPDWKPEAPPEPPRRRRPARTSRGDARGVRISARAARLRGLEHDWLERSTLGPQPFQLGVPALDLFPTRTWARLTARRWRQGTVRLGYGQPAGYQPLREAIASYICNARAAHCTPDEVFVVAGAQQALHLAASVLLDPGDAAWIEEPGYFGARMAFTAAGARIVPVPVDHEGLNVAAGERLEPGARLAYVTPSHQFPLGAVMSAPRRLELLAWARRVGAWILEDDYDSEFRYEGRPLACLQGMDRAEHEELDGSPRVLYVGTFSKTLAPGLRLGYVIVPETLVDTWRAAVVATDFHAGTFEQGVLTDFIGEGHYGRHLRRIRTAYADRQAALLSAVQEEGLADSIRVTPDPAGLHLVGWLPEGTSAIRAADAVNAAGVAAQPLSVHASPEGAAPSAAPTGEALLLGYAGFDEDRIRAAVARLGRGLAAL